MMSQRVEACEAKRTSHKNVDFEDGNQYPHQHQIQAETQRADQPLPHHARPATAWPEHQFFSAATSRHAWGGPTRWSSFPESKRVPGIANTEFDNAKSKLADSKGNDPPPATKHSSYRQVPSASAISAEPWSISSHV